MLTGKLLPAHPHPKHDEIFSSWVTRVAHAQGLKLQTFSALIFGRSKSIWNRDLDKSAPKWLQSKISKVTGTPRHVIHETTLASYEGVFYEHHQPNGYTKWITPLGIYHRTHRDYGMQYCPLCLADNSEPYYRKYWRLAFYTECDKHNVLMHDRCPECARPASFHRAEMGVRSLFAPRPVTHCYKCGFDLRRSPVMRTSCQDWRTFTACRSLLIFHSLGWAFLDKEVFPYAQQLFDVLRHLCKLMTSTRKGNRLLPFVAQKLGMDTSIIKRSRTMNFEQRSVLERHILFCCAVWLLLDWPNRFVAACKGLEISSAFILMDFSIPPYWFAATVNDRLFQGQYSPTNEELREAGNWLRKHGQRPTVAAVSRLLGYAPLKNRVLN